MHCTLHIVHKYTTHCTSPTLIACILYHEENKHLNKQKSNAKYTLIFAKGKVAITLVLIQRLVCINV